jgi:hypothetical protein
MAAGTAYEDIPWKENMDPISLEGYKDLVKRFKKSKARTWALESLEVEVNIIRGDCDHAVLYSWCFGMWCLFMSLPSLHLLT